MDESTQQANIDGAARFLKAALIELENQSLSLQDRIELFKVVGEYLTSVNGIKTAADTVSQIHHEANRQARLANNDINRLT